MNRRLTILSSIIFMAIALPSLAQENHTFIEQRSSYQDDVTESKASWDASGHITDYETVSFSWVRYVSMTHVPPSSLIVGYDGIQQVAVKQLRNQYRRFVRTAIDECWMVRQPNEQSRPLFLSSEERNWTGSHTAGEWGHRSWLDSLMPARGGAPALPYVHIVGSEMEWDFGPITVTNELKVRFDYITFFELNADPVETQNQPILSRFAVDVRPDKPRYKLGTSVRFGFEPYVRMAVPDRGDWTETVRSATLRATFDVIHRGRSVIEGEIEAGWKPGAGLTFAVEAALTSW